MSELDTPTATSNPAAERALVGTALLYPASFDDAACTPGDFELPFARTAWEALGALRATGAGVTVVTLADAIRTRSQDVSKQFAKTAMATLLEWSGEAQSSALAKDLAGIVQRAGLARRLVAACGESIARLRGADANLTEILADHRTAVALLEQAGDDEPVHVGDDMHRALEEISERCVSPDSSVIRTGIAALDAQIGGLRPGRQIVIAARPGVGKSALGVQWCVHAAVAQRIPSIVFSYEMGVQENIERILASAGNISVSKIGRGKLDVDDFVKLGNGARKMQGAPFWIYDKPSTLDKTLAVFRRWHTRNVKPGGMCLAMIDYIGLIKSSAQRGRNREQEISEISRAGKQTAALTKSTFIAISQLNRESDKEQRDPRMSDLRESGSIEQDADMIIFPVRDKNNEDNTGTGPARLLIAKNRTGPTGEVPVIWEGRYTRYVDTDAPPVESATDDPGF